MGSVANEEHSSDSPYTVKHEKTSRLTEVYTTQHVETRVSTVPENAVPETWKKSTEALYPNSSASGAYISEPFAGPTTARGSTYSYTYESHRDEPVEEIHSKEITSHELDPEFERTSTQTQKVTKVTKVTTTRSVRQLPYGKDGDFYFDANGSPIPSDELPPLYENVPYTDSELLTLGIDLTRDSSPLVNGVGKYEHNTINTYFESGGYTTSRVNPEDLPSRCGVPQITRIGNTDVDLTWIRPESEGKAGPILGYQVEFREIGSREWKPGHNFLARVTQCTVPELKPEAEYEFRVMAVNSAGYGIVSEPSTVVRLRPIVSVETYSSGSYNILTEDEIYTRKRSLWKGTSPGRPNVVSISADRVILEWAPAIVEPDCAPVAGYDVEYRAAESDLWIQSNDFLIDTCGYEVQNLRPNGEYEFRIFARSADGVSGPSSSSGLIRVRPSVPTRAPTQVIRSDICPPGQPHAIEVDSDWVKLIWDESASSSGVQVMYIVEYREIGDPLWYTAATRPIRENSYIVEHLRSNSTYEFRVFANERGCISAPSPVSDVIQLRPAARAGTVGHKVPSKPQPPEYANFKGGDRVTLCWYPAESSLPIQGYDVEFRDYQQDTAWYKVNELLIRSCKMTVGDLIRGHEYQFRVIAKNVIGFSLPSDPSPPILIGVPPDEEDVKFVEAERHATVPLLQDEIVRESPPLPEHDDSPPPIRRTPRTDVHWRDPTLKEVIEYLDSNDKVEQLNASGYLQHLTYNDNVIKEETRELKGIPKLVRLLGSDVSEIQKNACGCLKNLSFGKENDANKIAIANAGGLSGLAALIMHTPDAHVREEATAALWNLSSCDELKERMLEVATDAIVQRVVVPLSGLDRPNGVDPEKNYNTNIFMNGTGVLRNVSAASPKARKALRTFPYLIEALACYLGQAVGSGLFEVRSVENTVCILRNLSYRVQEAVDPNYGRDISDSGKRSAERSKSAPSGSPKTKRRDAKKKKAKVEHTISQSSLRSVPEMIWDSTLVRLYLKLLQESLNHEILEASAGAIQNLAACDFEPSAAVRACVRTEKGLPILVKLLGLNDDKVVCAVTTALRNLALDSRNRELIGKYAMKDLVSKLPKSEQRLRDPNIGDATIGAVLGILFETVKHSADFAKSLHDCGGTDRLRFLSRSYPTYSARVCKYASQVLYIMWQHKELHDGFRRQGLSESDFYSGVSSQVKESTTLARPISSQGAERPAHLRSENLDDSTSGYGMYIPGAYSSTYSVHGNSSVDYGSTAYNGRPPPQSFLQYGRQTPLQQLPLRERMGEPLYASVNKRNGADGSISGNSWV